MSGVIIYDSNNQLTRVSGYSKIVIKSGCTSIFGDGAESYAFREVAGILTSVDFEENPKLETISKYSFYQCKQLNTISLEKCSNLRSIGDYAFYECSSLTKIEFPSSLTTLGEKSFYKAGFSSVLIPASVTIVNRRCFANCTSLSDFRLEEGSMLKDFTSHVLIYTKITSFHVPQNLSWLSAYTFEGCTMVNKITVDPLNIYLTVHKSALYNTDLTYLVYCPSAIGDEYTVSNGTIQLMGASFISTQAIHIYLPETLYLIGSYCFSNSKTLYNITIPDGVEFINNSAFQNCQSLTKVILPSTLKSLGGGAFSQCPNNIIITFDPSSQYQLDNQNLIINKNNTDIVQCLLSDKTNYIINNTFINVLSRAFSGHKEIKSIVFEEGSKLEYIYDNAFYGCSMLETIEFPDTLKSIGSSAFSTCSKLTTLKFPKSLISIGSGAFESCSGIISVTFPIKKAIVSRRYIMSESNLISIYQNGFANCNQLSSLNLGDSIEFIGNNCFQNCYSLVTVELPESIVSLGTSLFMNCKSLISCDMNAIKIIDGINGSFFNNCTSFYNITFPQEFYTIGTSAFALTAIKNIRLPSCVKVLELSSFQQCNQLETFTIENDSQLMTIRGQTFSGCVNFSQIILGENTNFELWNDDALFTKNMTNFIVLPPKSNIKYFSFPETVQTIEACALEYCSNLEVIFLPKSIKTIQTRAFYHCTNLRFINIPISVEILNDVFTGCTNLQCGIAIENTDENYRNELVQVSKLPQYALSSCIRRCTQFQRSSMHIASYIFISLIHSNLIH